MIFTKKEGHYSVYDDAGECEDAELLGAIRKRRDGYFRFWPSRSAVLTCKQLRKLAEEVSRLNVGGDL